VWWRIFSSFPKGWLLAKPLASQSIRRDIYFSSNGPSQCLPNYDEKGNFIQSIGEGLFAHPHGLRIDADDNLWTTDDGSHLVLKLDPSGNVLLVLGRINTAAEANWLFNRPADVAFAKNGDIYVADGYGNSRVMKFDRLIAMETTSRRGANMEPGSVNSTCLILLPLIRKGASS
jgi:sugar lactone lactonase YvrE